jgi:aryl-alcohol dehydrogenase-like predicted oxidoreductase
MQYRALGRTGLEVSEIGFGAWGIGGSQWGGAEDAESSRALERAIDLGVNFIDTALAYGDGRSERLVGQVARRRPETVHVATKAPPKNRIWPAPAGVPLEEVFPGRYVRDCVERSLSNLGLEAVDLLQLHVWRDEWVGQGAFLETVEELRSAGKLRNCLK